MKPLMEPREMMNIRTSMRVLAMGLALSATGLAVAQTEPVFSVGPKFQEASGESLYQSICQGCHMTKGEGAHGSGAYPALAGDLRLASAAYPVSVVLNGQKGMPSFGDMLSDEQVASVVGYVRSHFGNAYAEAVSADSVKALRK